MPSEALVSLTLLFSLVTGTAACVMSLLTFEILQRSPFGRAVLILSIVLMLFVIYHAMLLLLPSWLILERAVLSVMYTGLAAFVWLMVWNQRRLRRGGEATP